MGIPSFREPWLKGKNLFIFLKGDNMTEAAVTKRRRGKQEDLPGVEASNRKIAEIEDLADILVEAQDKQSIAKEHVDDAMENLVASMRRHNKIFYSRPTFGSVILKESKIKAKVDRDKVIGADNDSPQMSDEEIDNFVKREFGNNGAEDPAQEE